MGENLFREEAYDNYSSMINTDKQIKSIGINAVIMTVLIAAVFAAVIIWFFTGNITETVNVDGIVTTDGGNMKIYVSGNGKISDMFVWDGAWVNAGDIIAVIPDEEKLKNIETLIKTGASDDEINQAREEYYSSSFVRALKNGVIRSVAAEGKYAYEGDTIAEMTIVEEYANNSKILAFIPSDKIQSVNLGMEVQVSPDFAPREEYGYINGYVSDIGSYPRIKENIINEHNMDELETVLEDGVNYMNMEITFIPDSESNSGVKWSNPKGNVLDVDVGVICTGSIVVKNCRPYEWFLG